MCVVLGLIPTPQKWGKAFLVRVHKEVRNMLLETGKW
jgi:hypothetical protein